MNWRFPLALVAVIAALVACGGSVAPTAGSAPSKPVEAPVTPSPAASPSGRLGSKPLIRIGSTNFGEQAVLGELYAVLLENKGYKVERKFNLGTREVVFPALESGQIDLEVDYLATLLLFVDKNARPSSDPKDVFQALQQAVTPKRLTVLQHAPAIDTNGFVVTATTAQKYNLRQLSDLKPVANQLVLGGAPECPQRPFCLRGLEDVYGLKFRDFTPLDTGGPLTVQALEANQVQVAEMFTTDPQIDVHHFLLLADDKHFQQADNVAPIMRSAALEQAGDDLKATINSVAPLLTTQQLMQLNREVSVDNKDAKSVAQNWLRANGLLK